MSLTRDQILSYVAPSPRPVDVPALGGTVYVRVLNGSLREQLEAATNEQEEEADNSRRATLLAFALCDQAGVPHFTADDIPALNELPAKILMELFNVAVEVNALGEDQSQRLKKN